VDKAFIITFTSSNINKKMKKTLLILCVFTMLVINGCSFSPAGHFEPLGNAVPISDKPEIEVYKYFYSKGNYVYISRFKNQPNIQTTTWQQSNGKTTTTLSNVVIFENDSIVVMKK
jgi:hypothetical protein